MKTDGTSSISGISVATSEVHGYDGQGAGKTLTSSGKFASKAVKSVEVALSHLGGKKTHGLHEVRKDAQTALSQRRTEVLNSAGNAQQAAKAASNTGISYGEDGKINVRDSEYLDTAIREILNLTTDEWVGSRVDTEGDKVTADDVREHGKNNSLLVVDAEKFEKQVNKDLAQFFSDTIRSTTTPHGLILLKSKISEQVDAGHIASSKETKLNKQIDKQFEAQLKQFAGYLNGITPETDSAQGRYEAAWKKLEAAHEMTTAIGQHNPSLLKKHRQELRELATASFQETVSTIPSELSSNLRETSALQDQIKEDRALLAEVLQATSKKPDQRLAEVDRSVSAAVSRLNDQLQEIPLLTQRLEVIAKDSVKELKTELSLATAVKTKQSRLETEQKNLRALGKGLLKSHARKASQAKIARFKEEINGLSFQIAESHSRVDSLRDEFSATKGIKDELEERYADTLDAIPPFETSPDYDFADKLEPLKASTGFTPFERATLEQYFSHLADLAVDKSVIDALADHYVTNAVKEGATPRAALGQLVNDSTFATTGIKNAGADPDNARVTVLEPPKPKKKQETVTTNTPTRPRSPTVPVSEGKHIGRASELASSLFAVKAAQSDVIQLTQYLKPVVGDSSVSPEGLAQLVDYFAERFKAGWTTPDLITGLDAGVKSLREGNSPEEATKAQATALYAIVEERKAQTTTDPEATDPEAIDPEAIDSGRYDIDDSE